MPALLQPIQQADYTKKQVHITHSTPLINCHPIPQISPNSNFLKLGHASSDILIFALAKLFPFDICMTHNPHPSKSISSHIPSLTSSNYLHESCLNGNPLKHFHTFAENQ